MLGLWYWSEGTISVNTVITPKVEAFYWTAIRFSQTLGTAFGDWIADTCGLGYQGGALVFAAGLAGPDNIIAVITTYISVDLAHYRFRTTIQARPLGKRRE